MLALINLCWQMFRDGIAERQSSLLSKLGNCDGCKHLIRRGEIKFGVKPIGNIEDLARQTISLLKDRNSAPGNKHCTGELVINNELLQECCETFNDLRFLHKDLSSRENLKLDAQ